MYMSPYLNYDGNCGEAFDFYAEALCGEIKTKFTYGETPAAEHVPASHRDKLMHVRLEFGGQVLLGSDTTPEYPFEGFKGVSIAINVDSPADAERVFNALSKGGKITMPLGETFWAASFGALVDQFGLPWLINCERKA